MTLLISAASSDDIVPANFNNERSGTPGGVGFPIRWAKASTCRRCSSFKRFNTAVSSAWRLLLTMIVHPR